MPDLLDLRNSFESLDVKRTVLLCVSRTAKDMAELNREQLSEGRKANNQIMPPYSRASVTKFGKPAGPIRLYDTGAFQKSIQVDVGSNEFEFVADDIHDLAKRYTDEIYGLGDIQQEYYNQEIFYTELMLEIEEVTGL